MVCTYVNTYIDVHIGTAPIFGLIMGIVARREGISGGLPNVNLRGAASFLGIQRIGREDAYGTSSQLTARSRPPKEGHPFWLAPGLVHRKRDDALAACLGHTLVGARTCPP